MRIAVYHDLPSGGAKRTLYEAAKRLVKRHTLDVYTLSTSDRNFCSLEHLVNAELVFNFVPSIRFSRPLGRFNQFHRWQDLQRLDRLARQIAKKIDTGNYDLVFAQPCMWTQAPLVLRYLETPSIYYCHEPPRHLYENHPRDVNTKRSVRSTLDRIDPLISLYRESARRFDQSAVHAAKLILVNSVFIRDRVRQIYGLDATISYHGVDTEIFHPECLKGEKPYVLSVGAIQPHKGFDFLVESLSTVKREIRPALHLVGNMENLSEKEGLLSLAKTKGVDLNIEVGIDQETLIRRYNEAIFVTYAPYNEPFGLVPLEAMACGKPVVGVNEGGVKETVIHQFTGLLVDRDAHRFGQAVQTLLETPDLIDHYGRNGRNHVVQNWSWERAVQELEEQFSLVMQKS